MEGRPPDIGRIEISEPAPMAQRSRPERGQEILDRPRG